MFAVIFGSSEDITTKKGKWLSDVIMQIAQITKLMKPCARCMFRGDYCANVFSGQLIRSLKITIKSF